MKLFFIIFSIIINSVYLQDENILCSDTFCTDYIDENPCSDLPEKCQIQNSTYNGIFLPSPDVCNCCQYCLENLGEGDNCAVGQIGSPNPTSICGPGLYCNDGNCERMNTTCTQKQDEYDSKRLDGTLGYMEVRPDCDRDGYFEAYKCIPGETCHCMDQSGNRIFGEIDFTPTPEYSLKCQCSRNYELAVSVIGKDLGPNEHFRCTENGDYDVYQCIGNKCLCVDALDGAPTYPDSPLINMNMTSSNTLPCFDNKLHTDGTYYYPCEEEYVSVLEEIKQLKTEGKFDLILDVEFPKCSLDGKYSPVQETITTQFCSDPNGKQIGNYVVDKSDTSNIENMNCKCARSSLIMTTVEKPECCPNGNFKKLQNRRGLYRCVDEDGNQNEQETEDPTLLSCYENPCSFNVF